ncbi:MAG TPA: biopolymer transporter ExbD [Burkholderiales bacterium]|nr:biopolymer transporter ExbD [Burkholderiales bacterium]
MAFGGFSDNDGTRPMAEINMIPLIDVMLVLLIIFIVTAPLLTHAIKINLPKATAQVNLEKPETVTLSIDASGNLFWDDARVDDAQLGANLAAAARKNPQPELHLRAEKTTQYQRLAEVMSAAQNAGVIKIGFITEPVRK